MSKEPQPLTQENLREFQGVVSNLLNPNGKYPQMDGYISNTFDFLLSSLEKIDSSDDKEKATDEVSKDIVNRLVSWAQPFLNQDTAEQNHVEVKAKAELPKSNSETSQK